MTDISSEMYKLERKKLFENWGDAAISRTKVSGFFLFYIKWYIL